MVNTIQKIRAARRIASALFALGVNPYQRVTRRGVHFALDLHEGIDLSLFLLGSFQGHVVKMIKRLVPRNGIVIDVGANIGAVALPAARHVAEGHVFAIEPTDFAFAKLVTNVGINSGIADRITAAQVCFSDRTEARSSLVAYSSWPVGGNDDPDRHPVHRGVPMVTTCPQTTLDAFVAQCQLPRLDMIKIDTDGHEFAVLSGASESIARFRPAIVFEACEYLMLPPRPTFEDFESFFADRGYTTCEGLSRRRIDAARFRATCPRGGGLDLLALPGEFVPTSS